MQEPIIVIGIGEMGGVFARGFLRAGHPVYPVTRGVAFEAALRAVAQPALVLVAVAEDDLHPTLEQIPEAWRTRLALLQNELLPGDWQRHAIDAPTVISVWFEKKKGQDAKVILPSPVHGPGAALIGTALESVEIPVHLLDSEESLSYELVRKNVYILTTNIAGLMTGGSVGALWGQNESLARAVANEVMEIQFALLGQTLAREALIQGMLEAIEADPDHKCTGRSAPARLRRALEHADRFGLAVTKLREIQEMV